MECRGIWNNWFSKRTPREVKKGIASGNKIYDSVKWSERFLWRRVINFNQSVLLFTPGDEWTCNCLSHWLQNGDFITIFIFREFLLWIKDKSLMCFVLETWRKIFIIKHVKNLNISSDINITCWSFCLLITIDFVFPLSMITQIDFNWLISKISHWHGSQGKLITDFFD